MSNYKYVHIKCPNHEKAIIDSRSEQCPYIVKSIGFPVYSYDLELDESYYPEYLLMKDLPSNTLFQYFIKYQP